MSLTHSETRYVKGMLARGDRQHDIASYFGLNSGRIAEVAAGNCDYPNAEPIKEGQLPPPGPYLTKYAVESVIESLNEAIKIIEIAEVEEHVEDVKAALLPLLPIQNAPQLEAVDITSEIRERAQDLPTAALDAFFDDRPEEDVLPLLENTG